MLHHGSQNNGDDERPARERGHLARSLNQVGQDGRSSIIPTSGQDARTPVREDNQTPFLKPYDEVQIHTHRLPHWQQGEVLCFVTWRLVDALPQEKLAQWKAERDSWIKAHPQPWSEETEQVFHKRFSDRLDEWLDAGHGQCLLKRPDIRKISANALHHFDNERYDLVSFVIMPNHVHVLFRLRNSHSLESLLHSWKGFTSKEINKRLNRSGPFWQEDYWDRLIRHERHLMACLDYIRSNPIKARLPVESYTHYINPHGSAGVSPAL